MASRTGTGGADAHDRSGGNGERKRLHPAAGTGDQGQPSLGGRGACRATAPSIAPAVKRTEEAEEDSERDNAKRILRTLATHLWPSKELQVRVHSSARGGCCGFENKGAGGGASGRAVLCVCSHTPNT